MAKKKTLAAHTYLIFISHAAIDKFFATTICDKIEQVGATYFRDDRDIHGGDDIPDEIRAQIVACDEFLVLLTPESLDRQWVILEIGAAWGLGKRIVPLCYRLDPTKMPDLIRMKRAYDLNHLDDYLRHLRERLTEAKS